MEKSAHKQSDGPTQVTRLLTDAAAGDRRAASDLLPIVYDQLRKIAQQRLSDERRGHTLQATALVHEAFLRLVGADELAWDGRGHFFAAAAEAMRRILIEHARKRGAVKRGGDWRRTVLGVADLATEENPGRLLALDEAIVRLEKEDARCASVVRLRFYAGLSVEHAAKALGVSERSVKRDWEYARVWLLRALEEEDAKTGDPPE